MIHLAYAIVCVEGAIYRAQSAGFDDDHPTIARLFRIRNKLRSLWL